MMHIDSYEFGKIIINGETYTTDVIILPDRVRDQWWRQQGHSLAIDDLKCIVDAKPTILIVGTGYMDGLRIPRVTHKYLANSNIEVIKKKTQEAVQLYNSLAKTEKNVVAALHLSC